MTPTHDPNRRDFLAVSTRAGAGWLALQSGVLASLAACAREDAARAAAFSNLSDGEGRTVRAFAAEILPSGDGLPGAEEAGAVYFIDRALGSYFQGMRPLIEQAVATLDERAASATPPAAGFADLESPARIEIMRDLETDAWFGGLRFLVLIGVFADPVHGGNRNSAGDALLGLERAASWSPPFGYYDGGGGTA